MVYTATDWLEMSMTAAQKLTALDNLDSMYSQAVSYIDAITHSSSYYTDAQAAALYFAAANDGAGSGLIAATLDGYTAQQIIDAGSPSGTIGWWSGSEASIPSGWVICNGLNGTPDLRNKFLVGSGSHYSKGTSGGANTITTSGTVTIAGHALTDNEIPHHTHGTITDYYGISSGRGNRDGSEGGYWLEAATEHDAYTGYSGSGSSHGHTGSLWSGTASKDKRPPYHALCYIMKS